MAELSFRLILLFAAVVVCAGRTAAQDKDGDKECSTEIVNADCTVTIDRSYPVVLPTIQMRPGAVVKVRIVHSLPFETLSLDLQSATAVAGTDQTAAFVTAALPNLKGLLIQSNINTAAVNLLSKSLTLKINGSDPQSVQKAKQDISDLNSKILSVSLDIDVFAKEATTVYAQLNEVFNPISPALFEPVGSPKPGVALASRRAPGSGVSEEFPRPWIRSEFESWLESMLCELAAQNCPAKADPSVTTLLADGLTLTTALAPCPNPAQPQVLACQMNTIQTDIANLPDQATRDSFSDTLHQLNVEFSVLGAYSAAITAVYKDLNNYFLNITLARSMVPPDPLGKIIDPRDNKGNANVKLSKWLGRQETFAVNAVNEVATPAVAVPTATQKKSVVTITVLYADPKFEVSAGDIISTLPNRSFANQTIVTQNPGSAPSLGNIVIAQTISKPTVVIFAGANYRLGQNFRWPDNRRGAFCFTGTVGLNVNNTNAEFGFGPSVSWRSLMFSVLYDWGHDVRLTQGEYVGMIWCNQTAANGSIPKCSGPPPAPSTEKYWKGVVAFGISVRIPAVFGGGGSSAASSGGGH